MRFSMRAIMSSSRLLKNMPELVRVCSSLGFAVSGSVTTDGVRRGFASVRMCSRSSGDVHGRAAARAQAAAVAVRPAVRLHCACVRHICKTLPLLVLVRHTSAVGCEHSALIARQPPQAVHLTTPAHAAALESQT